MKPEDFPIGSLESRAAARMQLAHRNDSRKRITMVWSIPRPGVDNSRVRFVTCQELKDGTLVRHIYRPHIWVKPGEAIPTCPDCGTPFKKTDEYPSMVGFAANCLDKHDPELLRQAARQCANRQTAS